MLSVLKSGGLALAILYIFSYLASPVHAWQPDYILRIANDSIAADCTVRNSVTVNRTSPGPTIRVREGDHVWIRVYNDMVDRNTTLHWHGVTQYMSPFADGTPQTSQWPIAPLNYFDYEFNLQKGSAGTYMYHTHVNFQIVTAYGAFIVEDASTPPFKYDEDLTLLFGDFYHASDANITDGLLGAPFTWPNDPQALTVNGHAFGQCNASVASCEDGCHTEIVSVKPSTTYRVRAIGITALSFLFMRIASHPALTLIEVDAGYVRPHPISHLELNSGQRYSFLLHTKSPSELEDLGQTVFWANMESRWRSTRSYGGWLLAYDYNLTSTDTSTPSSVSTLVSSSTSAVAPTQTNASALAYAPLPELNLTLPLPNETDTTTGNSTPFWVIPSLEPLNKTDVPPGDADVSRRVFVDMQQLSTGLGNTQKIFWHVDGVMYTERYPSTPYLVQAYTSGLQPQPNYTSALANGGFDNFSTKAFPLHLNETVDFVFLNLASYVGSLEAHPWHFHGSHPWLMAIGLGNFSDEAFAAARANMTGQPIRRDTQVLFPGPNGADYNVTNPAIPVGQNGGWMVFRLAAAELHAGAYLLHCHTQPHFTMGMGSVILIGMDEYEHGHGGLPALPEGFAAEYLKYNATPSAIPQSYFELVTGLENQTASS